MNVRVLWRLVAIQVMQATAYRAALWVYLVNSVAVPLIPLLVWLTVADQGVALPYARDQFVAYYVMLGLVSMVTATWVDETVPAEIRLGGLSPWLVRPTPYIAYHLTENIGQKLLNLPSMLALTALAALLFHADLRLPRDPRLWVLFAIALLLAAGLRFLLEYAICVLAFWLQDVQGVLDLQGAVSTLLSGQVVPLALFPGWLSGFLLVQPFRYTLSFPLEILAGTLTPGQLAQGFAWQGGYCVALATSGRLLWRHGLRTYAATGA